MDTYGDGKHIWAVKDLWEAAKNIEPVEMRLEDIAEFDQILDSHCWSDGPLSVREILGHGDRVARADLNYPIILTPTGCIADGVHRLMRALSERRQTIRVVKLPWMPKPLPGLPGPLP